MYVIYSFSSPFYSYSPPPSSSFFLTLSHIHVFFLCVCRSCAGGHSCSVFMIILAIQDAEDSLLQDSSPLSNSYNLSTLFLGSWRW